MPTVPRGRTASRCNKDEWNWIFRGLCYLLSQTFLGPAECLLGWIDRFVLVSSWIQDHIR